MSRPLIHIGFHKTGSTLLQQRLFNRADLGFERVDRESIHAAFVRYGPFEALKREPAAALRQQADAAEHRGHRLVLSHERLSGYPGTGGFDSQAIADRIHLLFPAAHILILVREQRSMVKSYYLQYISDGGHLSFRRLLDHPEPHLYRSPGFDLGFFEYDRCVAYYQRLFGVENVTVLPFEMFLSDPERLAQRILELGGGDYSHGVPEDIFATQINTANPMLMQIAGRCLNGLLTRNQLSNWGPINVRHFRGVYRRLRPLFAPFRFADAPLIRRLEAQIAEAIGDRYAEPNARLAALTRLDLAACGYSVAPSGRAAVSDG